MMFDDKLYEVLLQQMIMRMRDRYPDLDVREGSLLFYTQAPTARELEALYREMDIVLLETFADTASREYLIKRAGERGLVPRPATHAICAGQFTPITLDLPVGTRFSINTVNYAVTEKITDGKYKLVCEIAGYIGNIQFGQLIPINFVDGLETAKLTEILIPGEDEEDTEVFRARYFSSLNAAAFGGNISDYRENVTALDGVGGVKVYRAWNSDIRPAQLVPPSSFNSWFSGASIPTDIRTWLGGISNEAASGRLTVGGTVRLVIIDATYSSPSPTLIEYVQNAIDPPDDHAEGVGIAPIGHFVTVDGVTSETVNITTTITFQPEWTWPDVVPNAEIAIDAYFLELQKAWADSDTPLVVRVSQIETRLLACPGVVDIAGTQINGSSQNLVLGADSIPVRGSVSG